MNIYKLNVDIYKLKIYIYKLNICITKNYPTLKFDAFPVTFNSFFNSVHDQSLSHQLIVPKHVNLILLVLNESDAKSE